LKMETRNYDDTLVYIEGKSYNLTKIIVGDGTHANTGWHVYDVGGNTYIFRDWSNWQGAVTDYSILSHGEVRQMVIAKLEGVHPRRLANFLLSFDAETPDLDVEALRRRCRDALNKTADAAAIVQIARLLSVKI